MSITIPWSLSGVLCCLSLALGGYLILWGGRRRLTCPACRHGNLAHAKYCAQCGHRLIV